MADEETKDEAAEGGPQLATKHATSYKKVEKRAHMAVPASLGKKGAPREMIAAQEAEARERPYRTTIGSTVLGHFKHPEAKAAR